MGKLAPSLLAADCRFLDKQIKIMEEAGADCVHIDVMDGGFVPNLGFGIREIQGVRASTSLPLDVHMMIREPLRFVKQIKEAGADVITVHYEACADPKKAVTKIRDMGICAGIVLKPETELQVLDASLLLQVDVVQLMTVPPGLEGQRFLPDSLRRIRALRERIRQLGAECEIEADGDIGLENVQQVVQAGASVIVSGKALFEGDLRENIHKMKRLMNADAESQREVG